MVSVRCEHGLRHGRCLECQPEPWQLDLDEVGLIDDSQAPEWVLVGSVPLDGCWMWTGPRVRRYDGHGDRAVASRGGKVTTAARHLWTEMRGSLPRGVVVKHLCDSPMCVRPAHLLTGTAKSNTGDALRRGRLRPGGRAA